MTDRIDDIRADLREMRRENRTEHAAITEAMHSMTSRLDGVDGVLGAAVAWQERHDGAHGMKPGVAPSGWVANIWTLANAHRGKVFSALVLVLGLLAGVVQASPFLQGLVRLAR